VRPKVHQRAGLLSLPHLGNFRRTATFTTLAFIPRKHSPEGDTAAQQCHTSS